jgi:hypothetical protein
MRAIANESTAASSATRASRTGSVKKKTASRRSVLFANCGCLKQGRTGQDAVLADDGVQELLMNRNKRLEHVDDVDGIAITENGWRVVHLIHISINAHH